jgi:hypothetical protein
MVVEYDDILINYFGVHFSSLEGIDETFSHAMSYIKPHQNETFIMYSFNHFFFFFFVTCNDSDGDAQPHYSIWVTMINSIIICKHQVLNYVHHFKV